jgi:DAK2 domain fusion protein YloV
MLDAPALVRAMALYAQALEEFRGELDSLNVFPVPDGDTGTNLLQTQRAVVEALTAATAGLEATPTIDGVGATIAHAALTAARGNSGVILSQVLRAFCAGLPADGADGSSVARALEDAASAARRAVAQPKEGTVLTVLDAAAESAARAAEARVAAADVLDAALLGAREALGRTQSLLPELRAAGVVDAGGKGVVLLLDALHAAVTGGALTERPGPAGPVGRAVAHESSTAPLTFGYEVEFLLDGPQDDGVSELRRELSGMGDSLAIVGGGAVYRVHIHTDRPEEVVATAARAGTVRDASTTSLEEQVADCLGRAARAVQAGAGGVTETARCVLVAVLESSEVAEAIHSLGAVIVEPGEDDACTGQRVRAALSGIPAQGAVVLAPTSRADRPGGAATDGIAAEVVVVAVPSLPAAISAAAEFHPDATPLANLAAMAAAAQRCRTAELFAPEPSTAATAKAVTELAADLLASASDAEILTLVAGSGEAPEHVNAVTTALVERFPSLRVETLRGGRRNPAYQVGLE